MLRNVSSTPHPAGMSSWLSMKVGGNNRARDIPSLKRVESLLQSSFVRCKLCQSQFKLVDSSACFIGSAAVAKVIKPKLVKPTQLCFMLEFTSLCSQPFVGDVLIFCFRARLK